MGFTKMNELTPDSLITLDSFQPVQLDQRATESGKGKGGGVAMFINEGGTPAIFIQEQCCTSDI